MVKNKYFPFVLDQTKTIFAMQFARTKDDRVESNERVNPIKAAGAHLQSDYLENFHMGIIKIA